MFKVLKFPNVCNKCVVHVCNFVNNNKSINGFLFEFCDVSNYDKYMYDELTFSIN